VAGKEHRLDHVSICSGILLDNEDVGQNQRLFKREQQKEVKFVESVPVKDANLTNMQEISLNAS
jgi:hypothetical protein